MACNIITDITVDNCRLNLINSNNEIIAQFLLSNTTYTLYSDRIFIKDGITTWVIYSNMFPIGALSTIQDLADLIDTEISNCSTSVVPIEEIEATDIYTIETSTYTIPAGQRYVYIVNEGITVGSINGTNINVGGHFTFEMKTDLLGNLIVSPEYIIDATGTEFQIHYYK
jgi:hypothetical protein